jgi:hypothetical protein
MVCTYAGYLQHRGQGGYSTSSKIIVRHIRIEGTIAETNEDIGGGRGVNSERKKCVKVGMHASIRGSRQPTSRFGACRGLMLGHGEVAR